jgi:hypothetical protein
LLAAAVVVELMQTITLLLVVALVVLFISHRFLYQEPKQFRLVQVELAVAYQVMVLLAAIHTSVHLP